MLGALLVFLIGALVLVVVIYVCKLVMDMITLPPEVKQIGLLILGLIGFVLLLILAINIFHGGGIRAWL